MVTSDVEILARPGGNDQVLGKKVLLAALARDEAARLGIQPSASEVESFAESFLRDLQLIDPASVHKWLQEAGLSRPEFNDIMFDFVVVLAVEQRRAVQLEPRVEQHRRLVNARTDRVSALPDAR